MKELTTTKSLILCGDTEQAGLEAGSHQCSVRLSNRALDRNSAGIYRGKSTWIIPKPAVEHPFLHGFIVLVQLRTSPMQEPFQPSSSLNSQPSLPQAAFIPSTGVCLFPKDLAGGPALLHWGVMD